MYAIRAEADRGVLEAVFSAHVPTEEALRAISQAFVLAEAGGISRALCDVRGVDAGLTRGSLSVIAASFVARFFAGQRIAMLCTPEQLPLARHFARFARIGEELGVFTREPDARAWLESVPARTVSATALRHMKAMLADSRPAEDEPVLRRNSA